MPWFYFVNDKCIYRNRNKKNKGLTLSFDLIIATKIICELYMIEICIKDLLTSNFL